MTCRCLPTSPFRWREWASCVDVADLNRSTVTRMNSSRTVDLKRQQGIDMGNLNALSDKPERVVRKPKKFTTTGLK